MNSRYFLLLLLNFLIYKVWSQNSSADFFLPQSLRIDFALGGNKTNTNIYIHEFSFEPKWSGNLSPINAPAKYGELRVDVFDSITEERIYSYGFSSLFQEWQTTEEAKTISRMFEETVLIPFPIKTVKIVLSVRNKKNIFQPKNSFYVNPNNNLDINRSPKSQYEIFDISIKGKPEDKIDITFLPDGYTQKNKDLFIQDVQKFNHALMNISPFKEYSSHFNVRAIFCFSPDSGVDVPGANVWKNTTFSSSFYTFGSDRYLTTQSVWKLRDVTSSTYCDQIVILSLSDLYGGGGVFNSFSEVSSANGWSDRVFVHEFGHGFACLADEYYTSEVAYNDFFDLTVEPYQENITTLIDFDSKWKSLISKKTPIPTPATDEYLKSVGVFEGAGYSAKGIYRSSVDCMMKSLYYGKFCPVCSKAIENEIKKMSK